MKKSLIIKLVISLLFILLSCCLYTKVNNMNVVPNKYLVLLILILVVLNILGILFLLKKGVIGKIISGIIYVIIFIVSIIGIRYSNITIKIFNKAFDNQREHIVYDVIVLKDSGYTKIEDLSDKRVGYLLIDKIEYIHEINKSVVVNTEPHDMYSIYEGLMNKNLDGIIMKDSYINLIEDMYPDFSEKIEVLYAYTIDIPATKKREKVTKLKPVNIYISGLDNNSDVVEASGLSDVNMILTINPNNKTLLITSIPRDFFVELHGVEGEKDKLTHTGVYGIEMSKTTLEDLFDIKIDYTVKVGFVSVINVVNLIGGIDIESDTAFWSYHYKGWYVEEGMNHMDGAHALAYARERYAYPDGDYHRVRNQQQVFEAIFNKIITNKSMLYKYDTLLTELSNLYITDIPKEYVTLLIKSQISDMRSWKVIRQSVYGESFMTSCFTLPGWTVLAVEPNMDSVHEAKDKMEEVLNG